MDEYLEGNWLGNCTDPKSVYESSTLSMNDLMKSSGPLKYFPIAEKPTMETDSIQFNTIGNVQL